MTRFDRLACCLLLSLSACGGGSDTPAASTSSGNEAGPAPAARVVVHVPGRDPLRHVTAGVLTHGESWILEGCISATPGACPVAQRIPLDAAARAELAGLLEAVRDIRFCEPEPAAPTDRTYSLDLASGASFRGHLPADARAVAARVEPACRADARLAFWLAAWFVAASRPTRSLPSRIEVVVDRSSGATMELVSASVDLTVSAWTVAGCSAPEAGPCAQARRVPLDEAGRARLQFLLEGVRNEPCHEPFPERQPIRIAVGETYEGRCPADAALAWWMAELVAPPR